MAEKKTILIAGGSGYIGSHILIELLENGFAVVVIDNLDNGSEEAINRVREITGCSPTDLLLEVVDLLDLDALETVFKKKSHRHCEPFAACIHLAGLKAVGESVSKPLHYYQNNVSGSVNLFHLLDKYSCHDIVFSSSACVYGDPEKVPIDESFPTQPTNPYGQTKVFIEQILQDLSNSAPAKWNIISLRYFNPIGAHPSGKIGEDPQGYPNNLLPYVAQVAVGKRKQLSVFGKDYSTKDGTGVRDYIHITDLAKGHVAALEKLIRDTQDPVAAVNGPLIQVYNLGTGKGVSVLEVVKSFEKACGKPIPYVFAPRRAGDIAECYADPSKAREELKWTAKLGIDRMCEDAWRWQSNNPNGYRSIESNTTKKAPAVEERKALIFKLLS